jgi:Flp pilus assembly protein TadG
MWLVRKGSKRCRTSSPIEKHFVSKTDGAATIEFVLWLPLILFLFGLIADTAMIYSGRAQVLRVVQDANRAMSVGRIRETDDVQTFITSRIEEIAPNAVVETLLTDGVISSTVDIPASDFMSTNLVGMFSSLNVRVFAQHLSES